MHHNSFYQYGVAFQNFRLVRSCTQQSALAEDSALSSWGTRFTEGDLDRQRHRSPVNGHGYDLAWFQGE